MATTKTIHVKKHSKKHGKNSKSWEKEDDGKQPFYASPLFDFLYPFKAPGSQWVTQYIIVLFVLVISTAIGLGPYSGFNTPPMFGDFEAQRHWLEITQHLPISKWYWFDLEYWGLDYPPLTAYHSYILGKIGFFFWPPWFTLNESRGMETDGIKSYMRFTVLLSELVFYIPGVLYFTKWVGRRRKQSPVGQSIAAAAILFQPSLMLIDHGHFQYNCVMLGFTVLAINNLLDELYAMAAVCFVLSICFKQMSLYYAPIFFAILLSKSLFYPRWFNLARLFAIGIATVATFVAVFAPLYVFGGDARLENVIQSIHRIFPFARGIFEDKVANFWCVTNIFFKYKQLFTQEELQLYSLAATVAGFLPAFIITIFHPKKHLIPYALVACSMSFYLFSFQVHEKTILVPLLPITLMFVSSDWNVLSMIFWINNVALFTLWPLLKKDGLALQYFVIFIMYNWLLGNFSFVTPKFLPKSVTPGPSMSNVSSHYHRRSLLPDSIIWKLIIVVSYLCMFAIHIVDYAVPAPSQYPDLWVLLNCALGFGCFVLFWFWNYYKLFILRNKTIQDI
ncbi:dolichyl pyrophosphate Man9GlcNAc2 alpha-1,3-glucosyltransferase [Monosporozyma unispora]|nr:Glucosyltransferase-like protein [Kazachstania unispora]